MSYSFGVEIELIARPLDIQHPFPRRVYYRKLAESVNLQGGSAIADQLDGSRYRKHPEHYDKWWITKDSSLGGPEYPRIPVEVVSPTLSAPGNWEDEVNMFWGAFANVFRLPDEPELCGCHIHVSLAPSGTFSLPELKKIAIGVVLYEPLIHHLLPLCHQDNKYCPQNTLRSQILKYVMESADGWSGDTIYDCVGLKIYDKQELGDFMQKGPSDSTDRHPLWNFDNILPDQSGTVKFRGGHELRGPKETLKWISFVLSFIHLCSKENISWQIAQCGLYNEGIPQLSMSLFWRDITEAARSVKVGQHLPSDWRDMGGSSAQSRRDDGGN
ncbi:putative amidoligase enzyme-domain-containing protein [Xylaria grammica]|nr:putative amidoligase enzyme-domain-containing protein [Xylaria grammica]